MDAGSTIQHVTDVLFVGMEVLNALIELDVGENLIGHCQVLWPLKNLQNLTQV